MSKLLEVTLLGLFFGTFGTTLGGIIGVNFKNTSDKFLSFILALASGLMTAIVCFDLIPESTEISNIGTSITGIIFGIISMSICEIFINKKVNIHENVENKKNQLLRTGIIVSIGLALHNLPEGLAIGSGFGASVKLGYSLAIAICIHDIPEGISMAVPMKNGGMNPIRVVYYVILSGITTGIGALIGSIIGNISEGIISVCLSFAAGAMLYIVSGELTPEANKLYSGKTSTMGNIIGFIVGLIAVSL